MKLKASIIILLVSQVALAQNANRSRSTGARNRSPVQQANPKNTVGDLMRQADRGGGLNASEKSRTALPQTRDNLQPVTLRTLNQVKPPNTSTFMGQPTDDKARLERLTDQQIDELFRLTQRFRNSPQRGELWLRLAELYVEKASIIELRKNEAHEKALKDFNDKKTTRRPVLDLRDARDYNKKAIQLYEWFVRDFPRDEKMDQALFFLGYNNYEIGDVKKGTSYYERLTKEYPRSPFVMESNFALGEYYFENDRWADALRNYSQLTRNPRNRLYSFSLYKSAWCEFRLGNTARALKMAEDLIKFSRQQDAQAQVAGRNTVNQARLESEGLRDIVLFYSEAGNPNQAVRYFQQLTGSEADSYLERLAYLYGDKGNIAGAKTVFKHLIDSNPRNPKAFDFQYQVVRLYFTARRSREFREEIFYWVKQFGEGGVWYQANLNNKELTDNSYKLRETTLRNYVLQTHQTAQNSRAPFSQGLALEGYRLYLQEFPNSPTIGDMRFYFAELLYDMKKYDEAGAQYRWVVENAPNSKFYSKAAENVVISYEKDLPTDAEMQKKLGSSTQPIPLDPRVESFITVGNWYLSKFKDNEKALEIKFRIGRLYYQHNQFDRAVPIFREIVSNHPRTKYAEYSANLLLDIFNLKSDIAGLEQVGNELLANPSIANSKAGQDIRGVLEKAGFKRAQDLELSKDYSASAAQFEAFAKQNPTSDLAVAATFNAAINYERAGQSDKAMEAHTFVLSSKNPKAKEFQGRSQRIVAKLYQDSGRLEEAAKTYKTAADFPENKSLQANMLFNSAVLYEAIGQNRNAIQSYEEYLKVAKNRERFEAHYNMAQMQRKQGAKTRAIENYKAYLDSGVGSAEKNVESAYHAYQLSKELGRKTDSEEWKKRTIALQRRAAPNKKGPGAQYVAKFAFEDAVSSFNKMRAVQIPRDPAKQQAAAQQKIDMLTKLNTELAEVIKYDSPDEIVGSLSLLGQANHHMARSFIDAPVPAGLNPEQTQQYRANIAQIAEPFVVKAKESFRAALTRGSELDTYGEHYTAARNLLRQIDPAAVHEGAETATEFKQGEWVGL